MKRIAYIIPGGGESYTKERSYNKIARIFEEEGIEPIHVEIHWDRKGQATFANYDADFLKQFKKPRGKNKTYILGFSFGAMIAFLTATKTKPTALILCSLSPYFIEDWKNIEPEWLRWWNKKFKGTSDYSFNKLAAKIKSKTYIIVGAKEHISCIKRAKDAKKRIKNSSLILSKDAEHKIGKKEYLATIKKVVAKL